MTDLISKISRTLTLKTLLSARTLTHLVFIGVLICSNGLNTDASVGEDCAVEGFLRNDHQRLTNHDDKNNFGHVRCCVTLECSSGTEATLCSDVDPASTSCRKCKGGTFQPSPFESCYSSTVQCERHRVCTGGSRVLHEGNSTTNTVCECNLELGYYGNWPGCHKDKTCSFGYQLLLNGSCEQCPPNFHGASGGVRQCVPCSVCDKATHTIESNCTAIQNTICRNVTITDSTDGVGGPSTALYILGIVAGTAFVITVLLVVNALICYKHKLNCKTTEVVGTPSSTSSISDGVAQDAENLIPAKKPISNDRTENLTCKVRLYGLENNETDLPNSTLPLKANCDNSFRTSIIDLKETDEVVYEVETEAQQNPTANITMNGQTNIYGGRVVIHINGKTSCNT